jgi:hypothetical protein
MFGGKFWGDFPYFLPCMVVGGFVFVSFIVVLVFFKEVRQLPSGVECI